MKEIQEILTLLRENNEMLKEIVTTLRKTQDPDYIMEQDINDFVMNIVANLIADDIEGINGAAVNNA